MIPPEVRRKRDMLAAAECDVAWCDDYRLDGENMEGASPGGYLNRVGWYVIGTTAGGNAVVVSGDDPGVNFADHTWYDDKEIDFQDFRHGGEWVRLEFNEPNVRRSLFPLAGSIEEFLANTARIAGLLDKIG
jgi:hypothetical protein